MTMYLEHFGLREPPFRITPHTEFFFAGANRGATLEALVYAITAGEGMVKVTGEVGAGKTMLCRVLMERLPEKVETIYLAVPSLSRDEMLAAIAGELGIDTPGTSATQMLRALQARLIELHAQGKQVVALVDEAHAMPLTTLEEVRLLSNLETGKEKLLQIVLFGQPELDEHLALPNMRQLRERITHGFTLAPLPPRDIKDYIAFRLRAAGYHGPDLFGPDALRIIAEASEGLTRRINIYADKTLLAAFAAGTHTVIADHARAAVSDTQIVVTRRESPRRMAMAGALGVVAGLVAGFLLGKWTSPAATAAVAVAAPMATPVSAAAAVPVAPNPAAPVPTVLPEAAKNAPATPPLPPPKGGEMSPMSPPPAKDGGTSLMTSRLAAGASLLKDPGSTRFTIQLLVTDAADKAYLENYLASAGRVVKPDDLFLYAGGTVVAPRIGVLYGDFATREDAVKALGTLAPGLRSFGPYVRSAESVRDDVRRSARS